MARKKLKRQNEKGKRTGQELKRRDYLDVFNYCPKCGAALQPEEHDGQVMPTCQNERCRFIFWQTSNPAVVATILNGEGHVLLVVRGHEPDYGLLDLPGGFLKYGELPEEGLVRETQEEIGVEVAIDASLGFVMDDYYYQDMYINNLVIGYVATIVKGAPNADNQSEVKEIVWVDPYHYNPAELAFRCNEMFLERLKAQREKGDATV